MVSERSHRSQRNPLAHVRQHRQQISERPTVEKGGPIRGSRPADTDPLPSHEVRAGQADNLLFTIPAKAGPGQIAEDGFGCRHRGEHDPPGTGHVGPITNHLRNQLIPTRGIRPSDGHGGNQVLASLVQEWNADGVPVLLLPTRADWGAAYQAAGWSFGPHEDMHAGAFERSVLLYLAPDVVHLTVPEDVAVPDRPHFSATGLQAYTTSGVVGLPSYASRDAGARAWHVLTTAIRRTVEGWR